LLEGKSNLPAEDATSDTGKLIGATKELGETWRKN
jgi:hypothetical protein